MRHLENENRSLEDMLHVITEQNKMKQDYIAPTNQLQFRTIESEDRVHGTNHSQIVMEANNGEGTKILNVNQHCFYLIKKAVSITALVSASSASTLNCFWWSFFILVIVFAV